jgi:TPP-dependent indolepyruvate ferredoxin oxidoreductase alpha subunit
MSALAARHAPVRAVWGSRPGPDRAEDAVYVAAGSVQDAKAVGGAAVVVANDVIKNGKPATTPVK